MEKKLYLEECPICRGAGFIAHEGGWNVQVECTDCSAHTVYIEYNDPSIIPRFRIITKRKRRRLRRRLPTFGTSVRSSAASGESNKPEDETFGNRGKDPGADGICGAGCAGKYRKSVSF